jgi:hypothetical protein
MLIVFSVGLGTALLPTHTVRADIGPKESMDFAFHYQIETVPIIDGQLLECTDPTCKTNEPFRYGYFKCDASKCASWPYAISYTKYQKLVITFEDKTRESNVFTKVGFGAQYIVTVKDKSLRVQEVFAPTSFFNPIAVILFVPAVALTLLAELTVAILYFKIAKFSISPWLVVWANFLSLPVVWFLSPILQLVDSVTVILAELFAIVFEAVFLYLTAKKKGLSLRHAGMLSFIMNMASLALGAAVVSVLMLLSQLQ